MATPQHGIFALGATCHYYLEFDLAPGASFASAVEFLATISLNAPTTSRTNVVIGLAPDHWAAVAPGDTPEGALPFEAITGPDGFTMPATQHDAWVWLSAATPTAIFEHARAIAAALLGRMELASERAGFTYRDGRDFTGFVDGTENPKLGEAAEVALVPDDLNAAGASVALVQVWRHDLDAFEALALDEQEAVIGRSKAASIELSDEEKPTSAHIARVVIEEDGEELQILRRSTSFGGVREHGLVFVAFSAEQHRIATMLERMSGVGDGVRDALTRFSTPMSGGYYVVPSLEALNRVAPRSGAPPLS